ncbi:hypothetical protein FJZ20_01485 [Candidatus Pacearchaeota archaeon]|nr:hypothetical protein [Candidatus Pacearchaeota archaeon]
MRKKNFIYEKRGQIWVETVLYTLIAFVLIGLVLTFAKPKIEEYQDKSTIEQSISVLEEINVIIKNMGDAGNQRVVTLSLSQGVLNIDGENNKIFFELESRYEYSQPGINISIGNLIARTETKGKIYDVILTKDYAEEYNIRFKNNDELYSIKRAATPYKILISNKGKDELGKTIINAEVLN